MKDKKNINYFLGGCSLSASNGTSDKFISNTKGNK
jgi:hypothetical protein